MPGYWEDQGIKDLNGTVWYRREIDVPESMVGKPARLFMGRIIDADVIYVNGKQVGNKTYQYPQRRYDVSEDLLTAGKNTIVIRVSNYGEKGGFVPDKPYYLFTESDTIDLKGYWQYKVGQVFLPTPFAGGISLRHSPTGYFNGMIASFKDYSIKGIVWYQGESNAGRPIQYNDLLPALIADWRNIWGQNIPFLYAQLPNFMDVNYLPEESNWAQLRQSQLNALRIPNTAMAVALNLGEWNDIHPGNKKPIGDRLALAAQSLAYGEKDLVYSGPVYKSATVNDSIVTLSFDHVGSGLASSDGEDLKWISIAGEDKKFVWANSEIKDNKLVVWSDEIANPAYVRYAWMDNPDGANLSNKEGLLASPFEAVLFDKNQLWQGKKATVVLTYDDALEVHLDNAMPALEENGFKGTFYLSAAHPGSQNRIEDWKKAAIRGHELGNHTLYHPCRGEGRSWVSEVNDLDKYSTEQIVREIEMTNIFLQSLDGKTKRTFAYTCGDMSTGDGSFVDAIKDKFVSLRGVEGEINKVGDMDMTNLYCVGADGKTADQMIEWAEKAKQENGMLVLLYHGVGGGHNLSADLEEHNNFLKYLKENQKDFWVTTMLEASEHAINQSTK